MDSGMSWAPMRIQTDTGIAWHGIVCYIMRLGPHGWLAADLNVFSNVTFHSVTMN